MRDETIAANTYPAMLRRLVLPATILVFTSAAFTLAKAVRDGLYFERTGIADLPWAYLGVAVLAWPVGTLAFALMRRSGRQRGRILILSLVVALNLVLAVVARPGGGPLMTIAFMAIPLLYGVALAIGWLLGAEILDGTSISRPDAYGFLGSASMAGGVAGALIARGMAPIAGPNAMFAVAGAMLIVAMALTQQAPTRDQIQERPRRQLEGSPIAPEPRFLLRGPYTLWLLMLAGLGGAVGVLVEFQFYLAATASGVDPRARTEFFANFYAVLMSGGLAFQLLMVPRIQQRIGVRGSLMILPLVLAGAGAALAFGSTAFGQSGLRVAEGGLRSSVHRSSWEQVYLPFESGIREAAKLLVDGIGARFAEGVTAVLLLIWIATRPAGELLEANAGWMAYAVSAGALLWAVTLWRVRMPAECEERNAACPGIAEGCVITMLGSELWKSSTLARHLGTRFVRRPWPGALPSRRQIPWGVNTS